MKQIYTKHISLLFKSLIIIPFFFNFTPSHAVNLKGTVTDANTKEQIIGAVIRISELNISTATNLEGAYLFKNLAAGNYTLECKFLGLKTLTQKITIPSNGPDVHLDFKMESEDAIMQVNVVGKLNNETDVSARNSEQKADYEQNILSSQSIQLLPDITIANSLQRISGVTVQRNSTGDGKYAVVRGMEKRYNYTTINGVKIATPDNKNRYIPLDLFPNDIVERLEVIKSLLPSMEADAIGGVINMQLRTAPDYLMVRATVSAGYSGVFDDNPFQTYNANGINPRSPEQIHGINYLASPGSPDFTNTALDYKNINNPLNTTANVVLGNRFLKEHKLGIIFVGSYQNIYRGSKEDFFKPDNKPNGVQAPGTPNIYENYQGNAPSFDDLFIRQYYTQETRYAAHVNMDYQFNDLNSINFYTVYVRSAQQQVRIEDDSTLDIQRTGVGTGNVQNEYRSILTQQSIYNATLQGKHILFEGFKLDWSLVYDIATNNQPDYATFTTQTSASRDSTGKETHTPWTVLSLSRDWTNNTDKDVQGFLNLTYDRNLFGNDFEVQGGGMARHKTRDNYYIEYNMNPTGTGANPEYFTTVDNAQFVWEQANGGYGNIQNTNNYTLTEDITAGYIQAKYLFFNRLQLLAGFRAEATAENYNETYMPITYPAQNGSKSYYDILPGIHLKYSIDNKQNLRFSYYESLSRPNFYEITPYSVPGDYFTEQGNPYLKHTTADNYDLRYEWFPEGIDEVLVGTFYKKLYNPIEYGVIATGTSAEAIEPQNYGIATNYGAEVVVIKYFGRIGVSANYTYTNSQITTPKDLYTSSFQTIHVDETRPLQGQAANIGNLSLIYKDTKHGLSANLAFVYTGRNIAYVSAYYDLDYWQRATTQLDFSAEKSISKHLSVYVKLANLLNTPTILEIDQTNTFQAAWVQSHLTGDSPTEQAFLLKSVLPDQDRSNAITVQKSYYYASYLLGIRYKL